VAASRVTQDAAWLVEQVDLLRLEVNGKLDAEAKSRHAQFFTPPTVASLMSAMFQLRQRIIRLLDPGAGVGSLTAAFVAEVLRGRKLPKEIHVTAFEVDKVLASHLRTALAFCRQACQGAGVLFSGDIRRQDFVESAVQTQSLLSDSNSGGYDCVIMNPPYRKVRSSSETRRNLKTLGIETSNLYTAFMALAAGQMKVGGEMVSISPRSFCNGPYFRPFRRFFLDRMTIRQVHVFESRTRAFKEDSVLQENIIVHAERGASKPAYVLVSVSDEPSTAARTRRVPYEEVVDSRDPQLFIHLVTDDQAELAADRMSRMPSLLTDLGLSVSTGRVVDFRAEEHLRDQAESQAVPLIYPLHFEHGHIKWPNLAARKPNAIVANEDTDNLLVPPGTYVLVKRFSAKEERRRIVATIYDSEKISDTKVGFENHLNYYHSSGNGLQKAVATGLCLYLNSTLVDLYFRRFSGHTQVNAADLRRLRYPSEQQLRRLAQSAPARLDDQEQVDDVVEQVLF